MKLNIQIVRLILFIILGASILISSGCDGMPKRDTSDSFTDNFSDDITESSVADITEDSIGDDIESSAADISDTSSDELSNYIGLLKQGEIDVLTMTIYYVPPGLYTAFPWSTKDLKELYYDIKVTISGEQLRENIGVLEQLANTTFESIAEQGYDGFARIYYIFETEDNQNIYDVCMWSSTGGILVNGSEVKEQDIVYDVLRIFLPEKLAEELEIFLKYPNVPMIDYDSNIEPVNDEETAIMIAEQVWEMQFDEDIFNDIKNNRQPYIVYYYPEFDYWLIRAQTGQNRDGDAYASIGSDGYVYSAWIWED